jgi:hypothetical protein
MSKSVKPYLFKITEVFGGYETYTYRMTRTDTPLNTAHEIAQAERDGIWDDSHQGYWFDGNLLMLPTWRSLTEQEAEAWLKAEALKSQFWSLDDLSHEKEEQDNTETMHITVADRVTVVCDRTRVYAVQKEDLIRAKQDGLDDDDLFDTLQGDAKLEYVSGEFDEVEVVMVHSNEFDIPALELKDE